jgi:hypothetical protein
MSAVKMFLIGVAAFAVAGAGIWALAPKPEPSPLVPEIQAWFNDSLKDPGSLQIIKVDTAKPVNGVVGHYVAYRSKNGYGGYNDPEVILFKVGNGKATAELRMPYVPD